MLSSPSVRIVRDTAVLVRAHDGAEGHARDLLLRIIESDHVLPIPDEMLYELARVLRYPRMLALHGLSDGRIYDYIGFLRDPAAQNPNQGKLSHSQPSGSSFN